MHKKILVGLGCILLLSSCQLFSKNTQLREVVPVVSPAPKTVSLSLSEESLALDSEYIANLRLHGYTKIGEEGPYMQQKREIIEKYANGNRETNLLRAYAYLSGFESDFAKRDEVVQILCEKDSTLCEKFSAQVAISGTVKDIAGKPIQNATVEVLGANQKTVTDGEGKYAFSFTTISPTVLRIRVMKASYMIGIKKINVVDSVRATSTIQTFARDFVITSPSQSATIDTIAKTIEGKDTSVTAEGFLIQNPYTKYLIPFDAIVQNGKPYTGKVKAMVFEFDRSSGGFLLDSDAFDQNTHGYVSQLFVTYGMPFITFFTEAGEPLDVLSTNPMKIASTKREKDAMSDAPAYKEMYRIAYEVSQKAAGTYPIDNKWLMEQGSDTIIPPWWVFDQRRGFWDNVGKRFASPDPYASYAIESIFYTTVGK